MYEETNSHLSQSFDIEREEALNLESFLHSEKIKRANN